MEDDTDDIFYHVEEFDPDTEKKVVNYNTDTDNLLCCKYEEPSDEEATPDVKHKILIADELWLF